MNDFLERLAADAAPIRDRVREAVESGTSLRITGARRWLDAGRPVRADDELSTAAHAGVFEYIPGDLTMTVRAGTTLADIARATEKHGQWLALDPPGSDDGTIGATAATASAGALAHAFGTPRDQVIGAGFVTGRGDYVRAGGRVVKNVAGFDLTRLVIGAWGTLGAITDLTVRLRVRPEAETAMGLVLSGDAVKFRRAIDEILEAPLSPFSLELVNAEAARAIAAGSDTVLLARFGGNQSLLRAQRQTLASFGEVRDLESDVWSRLRTLETGGATVVRYSAPLAELPALWRRLDGQLEPARAFLHSTISRGTVRCIIPHSAADTLRELPPPHETLTRIFERLPQALWPELSPSPASDPLSRRVRAAFDPATLLNPGIFGELS